ncbi:hypothetical protein ABG067_009250, partial [Albugo candida]
MAEFYHIQSLSDYMIELKTARNQKDQLSEQLNVKSIGEEPESFTIHVDDKENRIWIDRSKIVDIMSKQ